MAAKKKNRSQVRAKQAAQARRAVAQAQRKRVRQRRLSIAAVVAVVAAVGVVAVLLAGGGDEVETAVDTTGTTAPASPSSTGAPASAAGKPCVPLADPLPQGAPAVPVKVGPAPTTLVTEDLKPGTGPVVAADQTLTVNYIGVACSTGKVFDASYGRGQPATFPLARVIPGWQQGIPGMKVGGQRLLGIPPELGYGGSGSGSDIAPGESLWFVVEVLDAKAAAPAPG